MSVREEEDEDPEGMQRDIARRRIRTL